MFIFSVPGDFHGLKQETPVPLELGLQRRFAVCRVARQVFGAAAGCRSEAGLVLAGTHLMCAEYK